MFAVLRQKRLLGDAGWALAGQLLSALALLAGTRILTEWVSPEVFGQVALLSGLVALGVAVFSYPFVFAGMRLLPECINLLERTALYQAVSGLTAFFTVLAVTLLLTGGALHSYQTGTPIGLFVLAALLLAVTVRRELGIQLLIGDRRQRAASLWQTSDSLLRPLLAIALVYWLGRDSAAIVLGYVLASVISNTLWSIRYGGRLDSHDRPQPILTRQYKRQVWTYALPLIPMELIFWLNGLGDRYVIGYLLTAAEVGLYAATYTIINEAFNRSAMVLLRTFQPAYFQAHAAGDSLEAFSVLKLWLASLAGMSGIGVVLVIACKELLADWFLATSYHAAIGLMGAIACGSALNALGTVFAQPLLARKRTQSVLKGRICGALVALVSLPLLVTAYGLPGAAIANPLYFGIEALVLAVLAKPWRRLPDRPSLEVASKQPSLEVAVSYADS